MPGAPWRPLDGARGIGARNPLKLQEARDQRWTDKRGGSFSIRISRGSLRIQSYPPSEAKRIRDTRPMWTGVRRRGNGRCLRTLLVLVCQLPCPDPRPLIPPFTTGTVVRLRERSGRARRKLADPRAYVLQRGPGKGL